MKTTLTKQEYLAVVALCHMATEHNKKVNEYTDALYEALDMKKDEHDGHASDMAWGDRGVDEGLKLMGITVEGA